MFTLKLLGALSLQSSAFSVPREAQQKRRLALLALLAVGENRGISRERLQSYLWPESSASHARHALDQLIYATRRSLGVNPIITEGQELRLDPGVIETDLRQFENSITNDDLEQAAAAYAGPLLDGFHVSDSRDLEAWLDGERSRIQTQFQNALESLARRSANKGDRQAASGWWLKLSLSDPLSSRIASETIQSFLCAGDNGAAIQHARNYQEFVRHELEVEPDPAIEKLISEVPKPQPGRPAARTKFEPPSALLPESASDTPRWRRRRILIPAIIGFTGLTVLAGIFTTVQSKNSSARPVAHLSVNADANASYLRGINAWNDRSKSALDTAVVYFRKAAESEPNFPEAYAGLANAYVMIGYSGYRSAGAMFPKAKAAALRAIELDSTIAAPYAALGMELTWERRFVAAEAAYRRAIRLEPSYATAHQWYGILLIILSRTSEALAETRLAAELDPLSLQIQNNYAAFLAASGQREAALRYYQKVVGDEPDSAWVRRNPWLLTNMASAYAADGQFDKALHFARRANEILPGHPRATTALANVYYRMGRIDEARRVFAASDTLNEHYPAYRAFMYATEHKPDSAFVAFDRVKEWGIPILISLPGLRKSPALGNDPRLERLFNRLGLPFVPLPSVTAQGTKPEENIPLNSRR